MKINININKSDFLTSAGKITQFPGAPCPQIALSGRSNVGKSSLINALLGRKSLARTSSSPGKTITVNFYNVDDKLYFADLPGYGYAKRSFEEKEAWSALTDGFFTQNPNIDRLKLVFQLVDVRNGPTEDDITMINWLKESKMSFVIVLAKSDKLSKTALTAAVEKIKNDYFSDSEYKIIPFSSVTKDGKTQLWNEIFSALDR